MRLLVVEDARKMSFLLRQAFREDGYAVDIESLGSEALWRASETDSTPSSCTSATPGRDRAG